jgi:hypothetical protein
MISLRAGSLVPKALLLSALSCVACGPAPSAKAARSPERAAQAQVDSSSCPSETLAPAKAFADQHPNDPEAQARLAEAYRDCFGRTQSREDARKAVDAYTKAALLSSQTGNLRYTRNLSELLVQLQDKAGLQESFGKILKQVPPDRQYVAVLDYADGLASLGDPAAWTFFDKALQLQPTGTVEGVNRYARQLIDHGEARKAVSLLQERLTPEQRLRFRLPAYLLREALQKAGMDTAPADQEIARIESRRPGRTRSRP